jgi:hypothetical protein
MITLISMTIQQTFMKTLSPVFLLCALLVAACMVLPVTAVVPAGNATASGSTPAAADSNQPFISAAASPSQPVVGEPVTVNGVAYGGNLTGGVQIWVFAGNYINVSTVPVNADRTFTKTYQTTGLPPATYYVIVQNPGADGQLNIALQTSGQYSGQVVNTITGAPVFNFTGTGSVQDSAAALALSSAFNQPGVDDIYTKCTFQLVEAGTPAPSASTVSTLPAPTATKSPLSPLVMVAGIGLAAIVMAVRSRR